MIRAYHDPALRTAVSRDGSWGAALEFACGSGQSREKTVYIHNPTSVSALIGLTVGDTTPFVAFLPPSIRAEPGITALTIRVEAGAGIVVPTTMDFAITGSVLVDVGDQTHADSAFSDMEHTQETEGLVGEVLLIEASAFALPTADERFGDLGDSPLRGVDAFTEYVASGMGFVDEEYRERVVKFMAEQLYDSALWSLNKHYRLDPLYGPMRLARVRADTIGYDPPGVRGLKPDDRRKAYSRAFQLARATGSKEGVLMAMSSIGIPVQEVLVWHESDLDTWYVRVPQWVLGQYDIDFIGNLALYHVDAYSVVNIGVHDDTVGNVYSDLDYTIEDPYVPPPGGGGSWDFGTFDAPTETADFGTLDSPLTISGSDFGGF